MKYSIDTNAIIDGRRRYYPPDVFPALWEKVEALVDTGELLASDEVFNELASVDDEILAWAKTRPSMFVSLDAGIQLAVTAILQSHPGLVDPLGQKSKADPFVIAVAQVSGAAVITGEKPSGNLLKPRIPNVCQALGVRVVSFWTSYATRGGRSSYVTRILSDIWVITRR